MLSAQGLMKSYGNQKILADVILDLEKGEIISVVGSSGSGKTTLLRLISGLEKPDSGQIILNNKVLNGGNTFTPPEKRDCSLVFQDYALFPNMSVQQNIYFGKNSVDNKKNIEQLIQITGIANIMEKYPHQCSGGEQQRVALVRSLAINPSLILMDEPMSNLDSNLKTNMTRVIREILKKFGTTAIIVTHDIMDAMNMSDRIAVLDEGKIMQIGEPEEVYKNPQSKKIALLFGETNFIPLDMFPTSRSKFFDVETNEHLISIRPGHFILPDESTASGPKVFAGEIVSLRKIATDYKIKLKCERLDLNISLRTLLDLTVGQKLKVIAS